MVQSNKQLKKILFYISLILLLVVVAIVHRNWIFSFSPLIAGDWAYFYLEQMKSWGPIHPVWMDYESIGRPMTQLNQVLLFTTFSWLSRLGLNYELISRIFFFYPISILSPIFTYQFLKKITKSKHGAILGALLYSFNSYFLIIKGGHMHLSFAYGMAPLVYILFYKNTYRHTILGVLITFIISLYEVRIAPLILLFGLLIQVYFNSKNVIQVFSFTKKILLSFSLYILLNFYWIITLISLGKSEVHGAALSQKPLNWISLINAITIHHPFWSNSQGVQDFIFTDPSITYYILFIFVLLGIFVGFRVNKKTTAFFSLLIVACIFFLSQENGPSSSFYSYLHSNLPFFGAFRESSKFYIFLAISYSVVISILTKYLISFIDTTKKITNYSIYFILSLLIIAIISPINPFLKNIYNKTYKRAEISTGYNQINQYIENQIPENSKTLWVTRTPKFSQLNSKKPGIDSLLLSEKVINRYDLNKQEKFGYLSKNYTNWLLGKMGISNIIVYNNTEDTEYTHYSDLSNFEYERLIETNGLSSRIIGNNKVYSNNKSTDYIRVSDNLHRINTYKDFDNYYNFFDFLDDDFDITNQENIPGSSFVEPLFFNFIDFEVGDSYIQETYEQNLFPGKIYNISNDENYFVSQKDDVIEISDSNIVDEDNILLESKQSINIDNDITKIKYVSDTHDFENKIPNPDLKNGLWKEEVSNCNNYDNFPLISINLDPDGLDDNSSLSLVAKRHIACTSVDSKDLVGGQDYLLTFYFKSDNAQWAGYLLDYNSDEERVVSERIKVENNEWNKVTRLISLPEDTENISLVLYSYEIDREKEATVKYDNFSLVKLPEISRDLFTLKNTETDLEPPKNINFVNTSPIEKNVEVISANKPFYLYLNESYHQKWFIRFDKNNQIMPWNNDGVYDSANHFEANGFMNGWYIDPNKICEQGGQHCTKNPDGSWDIEFTIEFWPQRWFNAGLVISGAAFIGIIIYLAYDFWKNRNKDVGGINNNPDPLLDNDDRFSLIYNDLEINESTNDHIIRVKENERKFILKNYKKPKPPKQRKIHF